MKTYWYLYKITNLVNGKIYVGVHQTTDLDDDYMGSGKLLKRAIKKHGIENFVKEILQFFDSPESMFEAESIFVNEDFVADPTTYNIAVGGHGGWEIYNSNSELQREKWKKAQPRLNELRNDPEWSKAFSKKMSEANKLSYKNGRVIWTPDFTGKRHTDESKAKIGAANAKHQSGSGNSQYGKMWIYNEDLKECKRIPKSDPIPEGWKRGRKMKF